MIKYFDMKIIMMNLRYDTTNEKQKPDQLAAYHALVLFNIDWLAKYWV